MDNLYYNFFGLNMNLQCLDEILLVLFLLSLLETNLFDRDKTALSHRTIALDQSGSFLLLENLSLLRLPSSLLDETLGYDTILFCLDRNRRSWNHLFHDETLFCLDKNPPDWSCLVRDENLFFPDMDRPEYMNLLVHDKIPGVHEHSAGRFDPGKIPVPENTIVLPILNLHSRDGGRRRHVPNWVDFLLPLVRRNLLHQNRRRCLLLLVFHQFAVGEIRKDELNLEVSQNALRLGTNFFRGVLVPDLFSQFVAFPAKAN